ncbi:MAG: sugar (pentulose or hexulose) kinase [Verrucomicrobiales bacterium]|jgi:sugar (pentulose or hexulose) kinase
MRVLGIDIGTTTVKGAVLDLESHEVGTPRVLAFPEPNPIEIPGRHETPMAAVLEAVGEVLDSLLEEAPDARHLTLCGQMHGVTLMDAQGHALTPFISWKDARALEPHPSGDGTYMDVLGGCLTDEERAALGNELRPGLGATALAHLQDQSGIPNQSVPATVCDAVMAAWTGSAPVLSPSFAASLGVYDLRTNAWAYDVIEKWNLSHLAWPMLGHQAHSVDELCWKGKSLTVYPALGDHQAALLGSGLQPDELSINVSTGAQIAALSSHFHSGSYQTRPYFAGFYLNTISHLPDGRSLNHLIDLLTELFPVRSSADEIWDHIHQATAKVRTTSLRVDLSSSSKDFERAESHMRGITEETSTIGHLFRAAFTSMAAAYRHHAKQLDPEIPWRTVALSGGLVQRSRALREEIEDAFGRPLRVSMESEETLRGLLEWGAQCISE